MNTYKLQIIQSGENVQGYIFDESAEPIIDEDDFVRLDTNGFNPLTILGDIEYISSNLCFEDSSNICVAEDALFQSPYETEECFSIKFDVRYNKQYFYIVNEIKKIIMSDTKVSRLELYKLANYLNIPVHYDLDLLENNNNNNDTINEELQIYSTYKYGLHKFEEDLDQQEEHLFIRSCSNISEIVFYIFYYLMLFDYHFFQCQHCKKYSAIKRSKGKNKYCFRACLLPFEEYETVCCNCGVSNLLGVIRKKKKRIYDNNNHLGKSNDEFLEEYSRINDLVKKNPSTENLLALYNFVDKSSKHKKQIQPHRKITCEHRTNQQSDL